jgi:4-hydroxy-tetrahydrodipicolinate reductase
MIKTALVGYGKMGKRIAEMAPEWDIEIGAVIDSPGDWEVQLPALKGCAVAIEFSTPQAAFDNIIRLLDLGIPVVSGTTGWDNRLEEAVVHAENRGVGLMVASNFSIGMNIFFALNRNLALMMASHQEYRVGVKEVHHVHKLDAPSGTAKSLMKDIIAHHPEYTGWQPTENNPGKSSVPVQSVRLGEVTGIHDVIYESACDRITISHEAFNRDGFATGAIAAAKWIIGKKGLHTMNEMLFGEENRSSSKEKSDR